MVRCGNSGAPQHVRCFVVKDNRFLASATAADLSFARHWSRRLVCWTCLVQLTTKPAVMLHRQAQKQAPPSAQVLKSPATQLPVCLAWPSDAVPTLRWCAPHMSVCHTLATANTNVLHATLSCTARPVLPCIDVGKPRSQVQIPLDTGTRPLCNNLTTHTGASLEAAQTLNMRLCVKPPQVFIHAHDVRT